MEPRFFYSTDGTDAHGPVTRDALRLLYQNKVIGPASFFCRQGETEWRPFRPETALRPPPSDRPAPFEPPPFVVTPQALERMKMPDLHEYDDGPIPRVLTAIFWLLALAGSILLTQVAAADDESCFFIAGAFVANLFLIAILPNAISNVLKRPRRRLARLAGLVVMASLILFAEVDSPILRLIATEGPMNDHDKGYYQGTAQKAEQDMQTISDEARGDSQSDRLTQDLLDVEKALMAEVAASQELENACQFDPTTLTDLDDLARRREDIRKLRDAQSQVVTFLQFYDSHCREAMAHDNFEESLVNETIAGSRKSRHIALFVKLWQTKIKITDGQLGRLDFLEKNWGRWSVTDGKLAFEETESTAGYDALMARLQKDADQVDSIQKQMFQ
jgi:hypothetical protein